MKRKSLFLIPFAVTMLASCGGENGGNGGGGDSSDGKTEIIFWHNCNSTSENTLKSFANAYMKEHENVTVTVTKKSGDYAALAESVKTGIAAGEKGSYPDLFYGYPDAVAYMIPTRKVANLSTYIEDPEIGLSEDEQDDYVSSYFDQGKHYNGREGDMYSVPFACSTEAMYYNKDIIGVTIDGVNNGQPIDTNYINNLTWEELFNNFCPKFMDWNSKQSADNKLLDTDTSTGEDYAVLSWSSDENSFITLCEQYGYDYTTSDNKGGAPAFNTPNVKNLLHTLQDAHNSHYFVTNGTFGTGSSYTNTLFSKKKTLFDIGSTGGGQYYAGENNQNVDVRLAKIPAPEGKNKKVILQGPSIAILKKSEEQAREAWKFYKYMTTTENCTAWSVNTGYSPLRYSVLDTQAWRNHAKTDAPERTLNKVYGLIAEYAPTVSQELFSSPVFKGSNECRTQVGSLLKSVVSKTVWNDSEVQGLMDAAENAALLKCK